MANNKNYLVSEQELIGVADTIRTKTNSSDPIAWPEGFKEKINNISNGGDNSLLTSIVDKTIKILSTDIIINIGEKVFCDCKALTRVNLPAATTINNYAFMNCSALVNANLPVATNIGRSIFSNCPVLTDIALPMVTIVSPSSFSRCLALTNITLSKATYIDSSAFSNCKALTSINLPAATTISGNAFISCGALTNVSLPSATSIGSNVFLYDDALTSLELSGPTVCTATSDPKISANCKIKVPANLLEQYKTATNWSKYASQFVAI